MKLIGIITLITISLISSYAGEIQMTSTPVEHRTELHGSDRLYELHFDRLSAELNADFALIELPVILEGCPVELILVNEDYDPDWATEPLDSNEVLPSPPPPSYPVMVSRNDTVVFDASAFIPDIVRGRALRILLKPALPDCAIETFIPTGNATLKAKYR